MKPILSLLAACGMLLCNGVALAADGGVTVSLTTHKIVAHAGRKETVESADRARPGDVLKYEATYRNTSARPVENVLATLPVPNGVDYLPGSGIPKALQASVDGKTFAAAPLKHWVTLPDGRREEQLVPVAAYRFLRWELGELRAGAAAKVSARMQLTAGPVAAAAAAKRSP